MKIYVVVVARVTAVGGQARAESEVICTTWSFVVKLGGFCGRRGTL